MVQSFAFVFWVTFLFSAIQFLIIEIVPKLKKVEVRENQFFLWEFFGKDQKKENGLEKNE